MRFVTNYVVLNVCGFSAACENPESSVLSSVAFMYVSLLSRFASLDGRKRELGMACILIRSLSRNDRMMYLLVLSEL